MHLIRNCALLLVILSFSFGYHPAHAQSTTAKVTDTTIELPGGSVFYRDAGGKGIPVVFLHSASGNSMLWEHQIPAFIAAGYRFIAIDYQGVDKSKNTDASTLIAELTTKLNLPKFHLLGTAAGGGVALQYALAHSEQLRSVIICNSNGYIKDREYSTMADRIRPPEFNRLPPEVRELGPSYRAANPEGQQHWLELTNADQGSIDGPNKSGKGHRGGGRNGHMDPSSTADLRMVTLNDLNGLKVPLLVMTGDADLYTPPSLLRVLSSRLKRVESAVIPESGHSSYWENPGVFNRTVLAFISKY
ncbi:MAG: alpha/beta fold hydrolase [Steroidobacteraceae bacterium]